LKGLIRINGVEEMMMKMRDLWYKKKRLSDRAEKNKRKAAAPPPRQPGKTKQNLLHSLLSFSC
jgi:hypothetical protein